MRKSKKLLALLLALALTLSLFGASVAFAEEDTDLLVSPPETIASAPEAYTYKPVTALNEGMDVMFVTEYEGKAYAFAYNEALTAEEVTVENGAVSYAGSTAVWNPREDEALESAGKPGVFIYAGSYGLMTYSTGREFAYDAEKKVVLMHNAYYMTFDGTSFSQSKDIAEACTITVYEKYVPFKAAEAMEVGNQYLFITAFEGAYYAFGYDGSALSTEAITIEDGIAIPASDAAKWTACEDEALESVCKPGVFVYAGSYGLMTYSTGREFAYDAEKKVVLMHNAYYMTFDGTSFSQSKDIAEACEILLFEKVMPKVAAEDKYIPDGNDIPAVVRDAKKNADGSITLAFVSDIHYATTYAENDVGVFLENLEKSFNYIDVVGFCGDMGSAYSATPEDYWTNSQAVMDYMDNYQVGKVVGNAIYTFGNHEWYPSAGGDYMNYYENETAKRYIRVGEAVRTSDYIVYCLGAGSVAAKMSSGYSEEDIAKIDAYLSAAPTDIPIFILTHFPIHAWTDRISKNADLLLNTLNKYPNIVYLWGHNHTDFDPYYDKILHAGDEIVIDKNGTVATLNFDYMSAGCVSDAQYTDVSGGSAWVLGKGLVVTIGADGTVSYDYYTREGKKMPEKGPYMVEFREGANYTTLDVQMVAEGKAAVAPAVPEVTNFVFSGWDTSFDCITNHTVVTAQYTYETGLDKNYVYLTVETPDGIAIGKSGTPILNYPIAYSTGLTVLNAYKALMDAEFAGGSAGLTSGGYGYLAGLWGYTSANGTYVMAPDESSGYLSATYAMTAGSCYYAMVYTENEDYASASYLSPFAASTTTGKAVSMFGEYWIFNSNTNKFENYGLTGDVYMGTSLETLTDTGINAVDGKFDISFKKAGTYYVVVKGDTVADAAAKITVTGATIEEPVVTDGEIYIVAAGDTLWSIAQKFYGTGKQWGKLYYANSGSVKNPRMIYVGQEIIVP